MHYLGIDIGSVSIGLALLDKNRTILKTAYGYHEGSITEKLESLLSNFSLHEINGIGISSSSPDIFTHPIRYDSRVSYIQAAQSMHPEIGSLLIIGGE